METKQVIVIRKDLHMRKGKMCAQASHASIAFLTRGMGVAQNIDDINDYGADVSFGNNQQFAIEVQEWLESSFRKICLYVNSEQELLNLHTKALGEGLISNLITDNGATEFDGVPTNTCIAIGPHEDHRFSELTDHLPLL